jgi:hypothetical protein
MRQLQGRWQRRLEIEAMECEHAERRATLAQRNFQGRNGTTQETPVRLTPEEIRQIPPGRDRQGLHGQHGELSTGKPGRRPRLDRHFVEYAGTLWQRATCDGHSNVPVDKLQPIASALDTADYLKPSKYLKEKYAIYLKAFNTHNSNSKLRHIKT